MSVIRRIFSVFESFSKLTSKVNVTKRSTYCISSFSFDAMSGKTQIFEKRTVFCVEPEQNLLAEFRQENSFFKIFLIFLK